MCGILLYSHCTMVPNASSTTGSPLKGRGKCTWPAFSSLLLYGWYLSLLPCSSRARPGREPYRNLQVQVPGYTTGSLTKVAVKRPRGEVHEVLRRAPARAKGQMRWYAATLRTISDGACPVPRKLTCARLAPGAPA